MAISGEEHVCIGCGIHVTTHRSQLCQWCRSGPPDRPSPTQTMFATNGQSADPRDYPYNEPETVDCDGDEDNDSNPEA
jgi:hypothetical protein